MKKRIQQEATEVTEKKSFASLLSQFAPVERILLFALAFAAMLARAAEPLPSWNDGPAKGSIIAFVNKATTEGSPDFVPVAERIAVFDNDGTLWAEMP